MTGNERDIARVISAYSKLIDRPYTLFHLYAIEITYDKGMNLGMDIDKSISYAFSWESLLQNQFNPVQTLALSLKASLVASADQVRVSSVIDTDVGIISGEEIKFQLGKDIDRPLYSVNEYGVQVITGYSTQHSGLIILMKGYNDGVNNWYVDFTTENSKSETDVTKTLTVLNTTAKLNNKQPVQVLAKMNMGTIKQEYENGIPFLCDIPFIGYLFRVTSEREEQRTVVFVLQLKDIKAQKFHTRGHYDFDSFLDISKALQSSFLKVMKLLGISNLNL